MDKIDDWWRLLLIWISYQGTIAFAHCNNITVPIPWIAMYWNDPGDLLSTPRRAEKKLHAYFICRVISLLQRRRLNHKMGIAWMIIIIRWICQHPFVFCHFLLVSMLLWCPRAGHKMKHANELSIQYFKIRCRGLQRLRLVSLAAAELHVWNDGTSNHNNRKTQWGFSFCLPMSFWTIFT